jgi:cobalamin biosynthesis protein CbiG
MSLQAQHDSSRQIFRVTLIGRWPTTEKQAETRAQLLASGTVDERTPVLIDIRGVSSGLNPENIRGAVAVAVAQQAVPIKRAILVSTPDQAAAARLIEQLGSLEGAEIRVFDDEDAAVEWLKKRDARVDRVAKL